MKSVAIPASDIVASAILDEDLAKERVMVGSKKLEGGGSVASGAPVLTGDEEQNAAGFAATPVWSAHFLCPWSPLGCDSSICDSNFPFLLAGSAR
jgi:hypothetical protein